MKKFGSRKQFRESLGATCKNTQWSWSWVNHKERIVYFGASDVHEKGDVQLILSRHWQKNLKGRTNPGFAEAVENIGLVSDKGYALYTFRQFEKKFDEETGRVKIVGFEQNLEQRFLFEADDGWYALPANDFEENAPEIDSEKRIVFLEGSKVPISGTRIERNNQARLACLNLHGTNCCICGFDFERVYGELGKDFIHVHHLKSLSDSTGEHVVYPETDLRPVCPNCHAMIHRNGENRSIETIRALVLKNV